MRITVGDRGHIPRRLGSRAPLSSPDRALRRDERLWRRELAAAQQAGVDKMYCPCKNCNCARQCTLQTVKRHLLTIGRAPSLRMWCGGNEDSSDDEWRNGFNPCTQMVCKRQRI